MTAKLSVFIATSLDGFIARTNGDLDWLSAGESQNKSGNEDYGYSEFMDSVDALIMGRNTFEKVLTFDEWPYRKKVVVLTSRTLTLPSELKSSVMIMSGAPTQIIQDLTEQDLQHFYIDGGVTIQKFLKAGLIDEMTITKIPIIIGDGIPLFGPIQNDIKLSHIATRSFSSGFVQSKYRVISEE